MDDVTTSDLTKFGYRELDMAADLLKVYSNNLVDFLSDGVNVFMNTNSGKVFLSDEDYNVGILEDGKIVKHYSCPQCGNEGTQKEGAENEWDFEGYNGYCTKTCEDKNKQ